MEMLRGGQGIRRGFSFVLLLVGWLTERRRLGGPEVKQTHQQKQQQSKGYNLFIINLLCFGALPAVVAGEGKRSGRGTEEPDRCEETP